MSTGRPGSGWGRGTRWVVAACLVDVAMIVLFVVAGRRSHEEGLTLTGVVRTAGPFVIAYAAAAVVGRIDRAPLSFGRAIGISGATVALGLLIRRIVGDGTAPAFVVVAFVTVVALMLGWRLVVRWIHRMLT